MSKSAYELESKAQKASLAQAADEYFQRTLERGRNMTEGLSVFEKRLAHIARKQDDIDARLARIEHLMVLQFRVDKRVEFELMALQKTDQEVIAEIHRNTDVAAAANIALVALVGRVGDLTAKLDAAIANSPAADDPAVRAALAELKASNDKQAAATAATAAAIANTNPDTPPPDVGGVQL